MLFVRLVHRRLLAARAAVGVGEEALEHRVGRRLARTLREELGERVVGRVPAGPGADQLQELDRQGADDRDLDLVERDGSAAAGNRFEVSWHQVRRYSVAACVRYLRSC